MYAQTHSSLFREPFTTTVLNMATHDITFLKSENFLIPKHLPHGSSGLIKMI